MTRSETVGPRQRETAIEFGLSPQCDNQPRVEARLYEPLLTERLGVALTQNPMTITWIAPVDADGGVSGSAGGGGMTPPKSCSVHVRSSGERFLQAAPQLACEEERYDVIDRVA